MSRLVIHLLIPVFIMLTLIAIIPSQRISPAAAQTPVVGEPTKHAVLIGINDYEGTGFNSLRFARTDMDKLEGMLKKAGFEVTLLTDKKATKKAVEDAVAKVGRERKLGSIILLAMSGHGIQSRSTNDDLDDAFFCPADGLKSQPDTMIRLPKLVEKLGERGPNLVLVDACRSDPKKGFNGNEFSGKLPGQTSLVLSCSAGQSAWETNRMYKDKPNFNERLSDGHGVFFFHVLEGISGKAVDKDGCVSWTMLVKYVGKCNDTAKLLLPEYAEIEARRNNKTVADLRFQSPNKIENVDVDFDPAITVVSGGDRPGDKGDIASVGKPRPMKWPCTEAEAKAAQMEWAEYLGMKVEEEIDIGGQQKMKFVLIPPGTFMMGSDDKGAGDYERPIHKVVLTKPFYLAKFECSQEQYVQLTGLENPSYFNGKKDNKAKGMDTRRWPVENVDCNDGDRCCKELSKRFGGRWLVARLPTEAEWEWACRAGTDTRFHKGNSLGLAPEVAKSDRLAALKQAAEKIEQLTQDQKNTNKTTDSVLSNPANLPDAKASQKEVAIGTEEVRRRRLPPNYDVKNALDKAAEGMKKANMSLENKDIGEAKSDQKNALKELVNAKNSLDQQVQVIEQLQEDIARLEVLKSKLEELAQLEKKVAEDAKSAAADPKKKETGAIATKQDELEPPTKDVGDELKEMAKQTKNTDLNGAEKLINIASKVEDAYMKQEGAKNDLKNNMSSAGGEKAKEAAKKLEQAANDLQEQVDEKKAMGADANFGGTLGRPWETTMGMPNAFGLYNMHGNVWEWCVDWKGDYKNELEVDPAGPVTGLLRLVRSGGWRESGGRCRSAMRGWLGPSDRDNDLGFRPALLPSGR